MQARAKLDYRRALAQFATGVTIVTTRGADGRPVGLTVNSFNSVSLEPPLVLWSLALKASSLPAFQQCRYYAVNVLAAGQLEAAKVFADSRADRFGRVRWHEGPFGMPVIDGTVAALIVSNRSRYIEGDHVILVGEVVTYDAPGGAPLVFHDGRYIARATEEPLPKAFSKPWR
jgi:flavin reductase (DIM6/NTAB) family NADH-FMN oxidoreductase RutF